jgi:hypothetical protein
MLAMHYWVMTAMYHHGIGAAAAVHLLAAHPGPVLAATAAILAGGLVRRLRRREG